MLPSQIDPYKEFTILLKNTLSPDNTERRNSESKLSSLDNDALIALLLQVHINENDIQLLEVSSVMLRRTIDRISSIKQIRPDLLENMKNMIPQLCLQQTNHQLRNKIVDVLCSLAILCDLKSSTRWAEISSFFYDCFISSNHDVGRKIGLRMIESAPCILKTFSKDVLDNIIKAVILNILSDPATCQKTIISSLKAFGSLATELSYKSVEKHFNDFYMALFNILRNTSDNDILTAVLSEIIIFSECRPKSLAKYIGQIIEILVALLSSQHTPEEVRKQIFECITSLAENLKHKFKNNGKEYLPSVVDIFIRHLTLIPEDSSWAFSVEDDADIEEEELSTAAETSLDRLTCAIGGKTLLPIIMTKLAPLFQSKVWQHRCAAITAVGCIAEGALKALKPHLPEVLDILVKFVNDEHPRVIYCCINTIGQLCVDYSCYFQKNFHEKVFPAIFYAAEAYSHIPRVQAHAVCCFINLIKDCPSNLVELYADKFFHSLHILFVKTVNEFNNPGIPLVLENVLSSLSSLAENLGSGFKKYYRLIAPDLISLIRSFSTTSHIKYYIDCLDTLSYILLAVGRDECIHELESVLSILKSFEFRGIKTHDSSTNYQIEYLDIMASIAEVFGETFSPLLPTLIPILLELCSAPLENQLIHSPVSNLDAFSSKNNLEKVISAHTDAIKDKNEACQILKKLCANIGPALDEYFDQICSVMLSNFSSSYDEDIQSTMCSMFPFLLRVRMSKSSNACFDLWLRIFEVIYQRIMNNNGLFLSDGAFSCIQSCLKVIQIQGVNNEILVKITQIINSEIGRLLKDIESFSSASEETQENDDSDDDIEDYELDDEESLLSSIHDLNRFLFKLLHSNYFPYFCQYFESIMQLSQCSDSTYRTWSLVIIGTIFEYCPNESLELSGRFLECFRQLLSDRSTSVRQATYYLVALIAQYASKQYQSFLSLSLPVLVAAISEKDSRSDEKVSATANAIAAVGRIMKHSPEIVSPFDPAVITFIYWLPIEEDEVDFILSYLIELIKTKYDLIAAPGCNHLFKALDALATMIPHSVDSTEMALGLLSNLRSHAAESFEYWYSNLNPTLKTNLESARSSAT